MGTNYYLMTRNEDLVHTDFAVSQSWGWDEKEYEIVESPYLGYEIHLNKCSWGWRPNFQSHTMFKSWKQLENYYLKHQKDFEIYDEYNKKLSWDEYKEIIFSHGDYEPQPLKWVYDYDDLDLQFHPETAKKRVHLVDCDPEEAELWTPINHIEYFKTENEAIKKFGGFCFKIEEKRWNDPDYPFDWSEGDFC